MKPICILGTGSHGAVTAAGLAELGCTSVGYDVSSERIAGLQRGAGAPGEPHVDDVLRKHLARGSVRFTSDLADAVRGAGLILISVGPVRNVWNAIHALAAMNLSACEAVVIRSAVPAGTCNAVATAFGNRTPVVYAPQLLRRGTALADFLSADRVIAGGDDVHAAAAFAALFEPLGVPVMLTSCRNAELIGAASNAYAAMKSAFANEVANLCDAVGADADDVLRGIEYGRRAGDALPAPGIGIGERRVEHDLQTLCEIAQRNGAPFRLAEATLTASREQRQRIVETVAAQVGRIHGSKIGVWGLASDAGTGDVHGSLAPRIIEDLTRLGATVTAFDPSVREVVLPPGASLTSSALTASAGADVLLVLTDWPEFARISPSAIAHSLKGIGVIDGRNLLDAERITSAGLQYRGLGRQMEAERYALPVAI